MSKLGFEVTPEAPKLIILHSFQNNLEGCPNLSPLEAAHPILESVYPSLNGRTKFSAVFFTDNSPFPRPHYTRYLFAARVIISMEKNELHFFELESNSNPCAC